MKRIVIFLALVVVFVAIACSPVVAETLPDPDATSDGDLDIGLSPPDLSAFTLLGINSNEVARPATVKELAFSFIDAGVTGSDIAPGIGVEWSPAKTFAAHDLKSYRAGYWWRAITTSFATGEDTLGKHVGFGFKWVPVDKSDPMLSKKLGSQVDTILMDAERDRYDSLCADFIGKKVVPVLAPIAGESLDTLLDLLQPDQNDLDFNPPMPRTATAAYDRLVAALKTKGIDTDDLSDEKKHNLRMIAEEYIALIIGFNDWESYAARKLKERKEAFKKDAWNALVVHLAAGGIWTSEEGNWKGLRTNYIRVYGGAAIPLWSFGQLVVQGSGDKYVRSDAVQDWGCSAGLRGLFGGSDLRGTLEAFYKHTKFTGDTPDAKEWKFTAGAEVRLGTGFWLELGFGTEGTGGDIKASDILTLANLKYSLNPSAKTKLPGEE